MKMRLSGIALGCALAFGNALAFGPDGHMTVGSIADSLMAGTNTGKEVRRILGSNLKTASVWADCAKGVNPKTFKYAKAGFAECAVYENDASKRAMESFVRRNVGTCPPALSKDPCHKQYHYTDVSVARVAYVQGQVGTSKQDIVAAISAAIAVLRDQPSPPPFHIASKREALRLLAHYVGDIHQPLHVAAVYLDDAGHLVDPDEGPFDPHSETHGGNDLLIGSRKLHGQWDAVPSSVSAQPPSTDTLQRARAVPMTLGDMSSWSEQWATETLGQGKRAFEAVSYSQADAAGHHSVKLPPGYASLKARIQDEQVTKAGARLAQVLTSLWP